MIKVCGLDLSLTGTGLAAIWGHPGEEMTHMNVSTGRLGSPAAGAHVHDRASRLRVLAGRLITACSNADLVVIEAPSFNSKGGSSHDRSGLWWLVVASLDHRGIPVVEVAPATLKVYGLGTSRGDKDQVVAAVVRRYGDLVPALSSNDEADALLLADMGARHYGLPLTDLPQTHTRAMTAPSWPTTRGVPA